MATKETTIANRPAGKPVFDFTIDAGIARVVLTPVSNDKNNYVVTGWAYLIDSNGVPVLDPATAAPIATLDSTRTVELSGIMAGTHSLYDGWVKYVPESGNVNAENLPEGWATGTGKPTVVGTIGDGYYDTASGIGYQFQQGCLEQIGESFADALDAQISTAALMASVGL